MKGFLCVCLASLLCLHDASLLRGENEVEAGAKSVNLRSNEEHEASTAVTKMQDCLELQEDQLTNQIHAFNGDVVEIANLQRYHDDKLRELEAAHAERQEDLRVASEAKLTQVENSIALAGRAKAKLNEELEETTKTVENLKQEALHLTEDLEGLEADITDSQMWTKEVTAGIKTSMKELKDLKTHLEACGDAAAVHQEKQALDTELTDLGIKLEESENSLADTQKAHMSARMLLEKVNKVNIIKNKVLELQGKARTAQEAYGCAQLANLPPHTQAELAKARKEKDGKSCYLQWAKIMDAKACKGVKDLGGKCQASSDKELMGRQSKNQKIEWQLKFRHRSLSEVQNGAKETLLDLVTASDGKGLDNKLEGMCNGLGKVFDSLKKEYEKYSDEAEAAANSKDQELEELYSKLSQGYADKESELNEDLRGTEKEVHTAEALLEVARAQEEEYTLQIREKEEQAADMEKQYDIAEENLDQLIEEEGKIGDQLEESIQELRKEQHENPTMCQDSEAKTKEAIEATTKTIAENKEQQKDLMQKHTHMVEQNAKLEEEREGFKADLAKFSTSIKRVSIDGKKIQQLLHVYSKMKSEVKYWDMVCKTRRDIDCDKHKNGETGVDVTVGTKDDESKDDESETTTKAPAPDRSRGGRDRRQPVTRAGGVGQKVGRPRSRR